MIKMASLLAVATVFIGLWTLIVQSEMGGLCVRMHNYGIFYGTCVSMVP